MCHIQSSCEKVKRAHKMPFCNRVPIQDKKVVFWSYYSNLIVYRILIIPQPITYSCDQVVTPSYSESKCPTTDNA